MSERDLSAEIRIGRVARTAGITREQARRAIAAMGEPPTGGPNYKRRMDLLREVCASMGQNAWIWTDATLEKRLSRYPRVAELIRLAKEADRPPETPTPAEASEASRLASATAYGEGANEAQRSDLTPCNPTTPVEGG